jgi:hypothetical protein
MLIIFNLFIYLNYSIIIVVNLLFNLNQFLTKKKYSNLTSKFNSLNYLKLN